MKWHNLNLSFRVKLSAGSKIIIFLACLFALLFLSTASKTIDDHLEFSVAACAAALGVGLYEGYKSNKLDIDVAEKNLGPKLDNIKRAAAGEEKCNETERKGDPLS